MLALAMHTKQHRAPSEAAIFWFLRWYKDTHNGDLYPFKSGAQLARDTGLNRKTVSRVMNDPPEWLQYFTAYLDTAPDE